VDRKLQLISAIVCLFSFIFILEANGEASSFPFREVNPGDQLPAITLNEVTSGQAVTVSSGTNTMLVFWAGDNEQKKKRALKVLKTIQEQESFLSEKKLTLYVINVGGDTPDVIGGVMSEAGLSMTPYLDPDLKAYGELGIFVTPSIMLVDQQGKIAAGLGYSRDFKKRLPGEVSIMLGEKDRETLEHELRPDTVEKSDEEKGAKRHLNLGMVMIERGQPETAMEELEKALTMEPDMTEAHIHLGCLYIEMSKIDQAKESLAKGLEAQPDSVKGQICQAQLTALDGDVDLAIDDLSFLLMRNARNPTLHYVLGTLYEGKAMVEKAAKEYRTAYELLLKKSHQP